MLPKSKDYLIDGGFTPVGASYLLIALFLAGVIGIQLLSSVIHRFIPSHIVDCNHTHEEDGNQVSDHEEMEEHCDEGFNDRVPAVRISTEPPEENTPLLSQDAEFNTHKHRLGSVPDEENGYVTAPSSRRASARPSLLPRGLTRTFTRLAGVGEKSNCDEGGPCMGFSDPCGQDCFKALTRRGSVLPSGAFTRQATFRGFPADFRVVPPVPEMDEDLAMSASSNDGNKGRPCTMTNGTAKPPITRSRSATHHYHHPENEHDGSLKQSRRPSSTHSHGNEHHHHVPTNAFLSIGLQTSLAIALHKAPEGFITYATNHANPALGFAVFIALFIHNITEGFAMALPLYLVPELPPSGSNWPKETMVWAPPRKGSMVACSRSLLVS